MNKSLKNYACSTILRGQIMCWKNDMDNKNYSHFYVTNNINYNMKK